MTIQKVGVVGCGLMGSGIAQVAAAAGFPTVVREVRQALQLVDGVTGVRVDVKDASQAASSAPPRCRPEPLQSRRSPRQTRSAQGSA